jgi:hypothetical protein
VIDCYGISLEALLRDRPAWTEEDVYRPALYSTAIGHLPSSIFPYDRDALKHAIQEFEHPYGRIAYVETVSDSCNPLNLARPIC